MQHIKINKSQFTIARVQLMSWRTVCKHCAKFVGMKIAMQNVCQSWNLPNFPMARLLHSIFPCNNHAQTLKKTLKVQNTKCFKPFFRANFGKLFTIGFGNSFKTCLNLSLELVCFKFFAPPWSPTCVFRLAAWNFSTKAHLALPKTKAIHLLLTFRALAKCNNVEAN